MRYFIVKLRAVPPLPAGGCADATRTCPKPVQSVQTPIGGVDLDSFGFCPFWSPISRLLRGRFLEQLRNYLLAVVLSKGRMWLRSAGHS